MEMEKENLDAIIENHARWLETDGGKRADLRKARIEGNLCGVNLRGANLSEANLHGVNLSEADLRGADLPTGFYQIVGVGSYNRCTTYDSINDRVICGCWNDNAGNHLDSFARRIEQIYGTEGEDPDLEYYTEYMSMVNFFKAMKELRYRFYDNGGEGL